MKRKFLYVFTIVVFLSSIFPAMAYRDQGYLYLSPVPNAEYVSPNTEFFLVRFSDVQPADVTNLSSFIEVIGASSGLHTGTAQIASDNRTVIFEVDSGFQQDELVTVSLNPTLAPGAEGSVDPYSYQFMISNYMPGSAPQQVYVEKSQFNDNPPVVLTASSDSTPAEQGKAGLMPNGVSVPSNFPHIEITTNDNPDDGYIFIDNRTSGSNSYNVIFDNTGSPIWYNQTNDERRDMKVQPNGMLTMLARDGYYRFIGLDENYNEVAEYKAVNGYTTDEHELIVLENGYYLLIGLRYNTVDMSRYVTGGQTNANVRETVIQEFTPNNELIFQWRAWDNFDISDIHVDSPTSSHIRFSHMNAIHIDSDGHILLSCRNLSEISKIDRDTGEFIWRLNGAHNDFTYVGDSLNGFSCQHAIRNVGPNRYLLFDNGNYHSPSVSRGVEYEIDTNVMTATLIWEYREVPDWYSHYMGNTQRLTNGNTLVNWVIGNQPKLTEIRPDGTKAFEMNWINNYQAYRVWRCPWEGMALKPNLIIESDEGYPLLLFNKFGDPNVAYYKIYGGTSPQPTELLVTSTTTMKRLDNLRSGNEYYFRVTAVNHDDSESDYSEEKSMYVNIFVPGKNLVLNGDFSEGKNDWIWEVTDSAQAQWHIENSIAHHEISQPGTQVYNVQMRQAGIPLYQGKEYVFEYDAWISEGLFRTIEAKIGQDQSPWTDYSQISPLPILTQEPTHYRCEFTMLENDDLNARVVFNTGTSTEDVYIDNIVLFAVAPGDFNKDGLVRLDDFAAISQQWQQTDSGLSADLDEDGHVNMNDLIIFFSNWSLSLEMFPVLPGDFNKDGTVKLDDYSVFCNQWNQNGYEFVADLDDNGTVNIVDLSIFADNWLSVIK